jgi:hypothetical protein
MVEAPHVLIDGARMGRNIENMAACGGPREGVLGDTGVVGERCRQ